MDAAHFAGFWLRHQRIGTRSTSNLFPARALLMKLASKSGEMMAKKTRPDSSRTRIGRAARNVARNKVQVPRNEPRTAFDIFGSDLPDEAFAEIFDQPRDGGWRDIEFD
jgi:hypothetical protein